MLIVSTIEDSKTWKYYLGITTYIKTLRFNLISFHNLFEIPPVAKVNVEQFWKKKQFSSLDVATFKLRAINRKSVFKQETTKVL